MTVDDLTSRTVDAFLDEVAQRTPAPGGGSVTALAGALACALGRMVAAYSVSPKGEPNARSTAEAAVAKLRRCDQLLRALITQDAQAYLELSAAAKAAPTEASAGDPAARTETYQQAVLNAAAVPMEIAAIASNALMTFDEMKTAVRPGLLSDLGIAAILAETAARAAALTVQTNLPQLADRQKQGDFRSELDGILQHCVARRESIERFLHQRL